MPEDGFEVLCTEVSGLDLSDFLDAMVRGTGELPLQAMLSSHGIDYRIRRRSGRRDKGGTPVGREATAALWLGANLTERDGKLVFAVVMNGGPAELAGVAPGDVAVALDGVALTAANCDRRLRSYHDGDSLELVLFRGDDLITTSIKIAAAPDDTCYLTLVDDVDADTESRRAAWLHGS